MLVKTYCAAVNGMEVTTITVEVNVTRGVMYHLTGLGDSAVKEGKDRIAAALQNNGYKFPIADLTINLAPADLRKEGSSFDLPLAIGILAASGGIESHCLDQYMMVGELSLDGHLQPIKGALPIAIRARAEKFKGLIVPRQNVMEAAVVNNLEVYGMDTIMDVIQLVTGLKDFEPTVIDTRKKFYESQYQFDIDFADVRGQENVKRALEVAAAGSHNVILIGPRLGQVYDGQAFPYHHAATHAGRESGDHADTLHRRQAGRQHVAHHPAPLPESAPHHLRGGTRGRRL